ncbi:FANCD2 opposite strand protein [Gastrophryne carolinensis]
MMTYQLWSPWTVLDENLQWLRRAEPEMGTASTCRCIQEEVVQDLCRLLGRRLPGHRMTLDPATLSSSRKVVWDTQDVLAPRPIHLHGLDMVFGNIITAQAPRWSGSLRVSDRSAF